ncbi:hypothetical protein OsJ_02109 [Oryza sativa Japonica Group]|uniref:Uncharacterized protein n=1 Tax=Oryza sativa subsp. japonica TaxID=39947 RepID=B9EXD6_ORYSJ|nr:hypothetical protein OsJ_02109 [Oryza sativa Japonica Group]
MMGLAIPNLPETAPQLLFCPVGEIGCHKACAMRVQTLVVPNDSALVSLPHLFNPRPLGVSPHKPISFMAVNVCPQLAEGHVHYSTKPSGRVPASLKARFSKMSLTKSRKYVYLICLDALLKERDASHTGIGGPGSQTRLGHRLSLPIILRFRFYTSRGSSQAGPLQGHRGPRIPSWSGIQAPLRTFSEDINLVRLDTLLEARGETYKGKARQWLTIIRMERTRPQPPLS